jgi:hypothetical protein
MGQGSSGSVSIELNRRHYLVIVNMLRTYSQNHADASEQKAMQIGQIIQLVLNRTPEKEYIQVAMDLGYWNEIIPILQESCKDRGSDWQTWGEKIIEIIEKSTNPIPDGSPRQAPPETAQPRQTPASPSTKTSFPERQPLLSSEVKPDRGKTLPIKYIPIPPPAIPIGEGGDRLGYHVDRGLLVKSPGSIAVFLEAARMDLYRVNAFRVMEMPVDANPRELSKRQHMVDMAINTGLPIPPGSFCALPLPETADSSAMREALQRMRDPERRLIDEFFWFWPYKLNNSKTDEALQALSRNDVEAACKIWINQEMEQSEANISVHNLAVLSHAFALEMEEKTWNGNLTKEQEKQRDSYWDLAFKRWKILLDYENFWGRLTMRIRDLDDPRLTTGMARRMRDSLPLMLLIINAQMAVRAAERGDAAGASRHRELMNHSGFEREDIEEALRCALGPIREMIKSMCRTASSEGNADPQHADKVSLRLLEQARPRLAVLDNVLPPGHATRDSLHDEVAQQMLSSQIMFGNKTENWEESLRILNLIKTVAVGPFIHTRLEENIKTVKANLEFYLCWFCKKRKSDKASGIEVTMSGEVTRTPFFEYGRSGTRIQWKNRTITVPRCPICMKAHSKKSSASWIGVSIGSLIGLVGCIGLVTSNSSGSDPMCGGLTVLAVCAGIGAAIGAAIGSARQPKGIRPASAMNEFPIIKELRSQGWTIGAKPPGVQ